LYVAQAFGSDLVYLRTVGSDTKQKFTIVKMGRSGLASNYATLIIPASLSIVVTDVFDSTIL
jgi:hypothetical protein